MFSVKGKDTHGYYIVFTYLLTYYLFAYLSTYLLIYLLTFLLTYLLIYLLLGRTLADMLFIKHCHVWSDTPIKEI